MEKCAKIIVFLFFTFSPFLFFAKGNQPTIESIELLVDSSRSMNFKNVEKSENFKKIKNGFASSFNSANYWFKIKVNPRQ